jgi:hypothetical protein
VDLGVDLCNTRLIREGAVETTWPWVHQHFNHPLPKRLNPTVEKVCIRCTSVSPSYHNYWMTSHIGCNLLRSFLATPCPQLGQLLVNTRSGAASSFLKWNHSSQHPVTPGFVAKLNGHSTCAQESSLHTYRTENGYRITNVTIYNIFTE